MVFSSLTFIYLFLPICLFLYYLRKSINYRNTILLIMSLFFYAWGEPKWIIILILSTLVEYFGGLAIDKFRDTWKSKAALTLSVIVDLSFLLFFKYFNFFATSVNNVFNLNIKLLSLGLPIGISFYTFHAITYLVDVYRGRVNVQRNYKNLLLYISMFPQLVAGPIVKYIDIEEQINDRKVTVKDFSYGITRFLVGLGKKAILANFAGDIATNFIGSDLRSISVVGAWLGILGYTFQIYFDFSGYSDMAIGLGRMFGFKYFENFNYPYIAKSITEFWKRWHISLTTFFREYIYIPLGGNRKHHIINLLIIWTLTGLWHGASWNFVLWGLYYYIFIVLERLFLDNVLEKIPSFIRHIYTMFVVIIGWVFFYFDDLSSLKYMLKLMFGFSGQPFTAVTDSVYITNHIFFFIIAIIACTPLVANVSKRVLNKISSIDYFSTTVADMLNIIYNVILLIICTATLVGSTYNPFLYFRF